jgi:hypothetical protein
MIDHEHAHCHRTVTVTLPDAQRALILNNMTDALRKIKIKIEDIYGDDSVSWSEKSYIVDWQVSGSFLK